MNFSEIFRKYDKVVESFIKKTTSKTTRDIIKVADKYVSKDEEILRQLKEFIKQDGNNEEGFGFRIDLPGIWSIEQQNNEGEFEDWCIIELNLITSMVDGMYTYSVIDLGDEDSYVEVVAVKSDDYAYCVSVRWEELDVKIRNGILDYLNFTDLRYDQINESFTRKISRKNNDDLISKADADIAFEIPDGIYILQEPLGIKTVNGWNPKDNESVVGILVVEKNRKIVVALEDAPEELLWSKDKEPQLVNGRISNWQDAEFDFRGEYYCRKLNSPDFPAAYYCLNYKKGGRKWHLPSAGELMMISRHLDEIQNALETVGGQKFATKNYEQNDVPSYWSSTENYYNNAYSLYFYDIDVESHPIISTKHYLPEKVRPVSKCCSSNKPFAGKISRKKNDEQKVYILHETLGVKTIDGWNPKDNEGVVGILLIEKDRKIVIALEDAPEPTQWAEVEELINEPFDYREHCRNLNSPDFPAAYYCLNYKKGGRNWYLPSAGELWMIYNNLEDIQTALKTVGGQEFVTSWDEGNAEYWSSTEGGETTTWYLGLGFENFTDHRGHIMWGHVGRFCSIRPVSKFDSSNTLKESFTRKTSKTKKEELRTRADKSLVLPKNYIELALMSVLCLAKKEVICFRKPKFHYKDDFGDVYELSEVFLQNDGQEIGTYAQRHYLEIEWNVYENGHMEEEPANDYYPFKDEDDEIKIEIYKRVLQYLDMEYVRPDILWRTFDDEGFDYFDN